MKTFMNRNCFTSHPTNRRETMKYSEKLITFTTLSLLPILLISTFIRVEAMCPKPADIKPCTCDNEGLQCLKLNNSGLVRVFKAPAEHKAIRSVWIFQTNLTELPANAFGDYFIRDLYLDLNQITQIEPSAFGQATKTLQKLSLTRNLLTYFPFSALRRMKRLRQLALGSNQLVKICGDLIPPSDTLEHIDLGNNSIEHIEPNAFSELHELEMINLSRNKLRKIESMALSVKSSSDLHIIMRMNQISKIAVDAFGQHYPKHIDLSNNELTYLDRLTFEPLLKSNTTIDVDGCDVYRWLVELDRNYKINLVNFACNQTKLKDLTLEMIGCEANECPGVSKRHKL